MIEAKQVDATHVELGLVDEAGLLQQCSGEVVVQLHIAQLQECTVTLPEGAGLVVVGIAGGGQTWEGSIRVGVAGCPASIVIFL